MPTFLIAAASALLLAALTTEASQRFFPDSYFALLAITFVALLINGLFNARLRQADGSGTRNAASKGQNKPRQKPAQEPRARGDKGKSRKPAQEKNRARAEQRSAEPGSSGTRSDSVESAPVPDGPRETGTVKWFNRSKGYGFIVRDNGEEIFVHQRSILRDNDRQRPVLRDGQSVSFVVSQQDKGAQAEGVEGLD